MSGTAASTGRGRRPLRAPATTSVGQAVLAVGYVLVGLGLATAMAWPIFDTWRLAVIACVCGVLGAAIAVLARLLRWHVLVTVLLTAGVYLVGVVPLAVPSALSSPQGILGGVRDGVVGVVLGWRQLLTLDLPVGSYQAVLVPFFAMALIGTVAAVSIALMPSRSAAWSVLIVLLFGVFGIAFAATDPGSPVVLAGVEITAPREVLLGVLLVAVSMLWLLVRTRLQRRAALSLARSTTTVHVQRGSAGAALRRGVLGAGLVVVALIAGVAAMPVAFGATPRTTLRTGAEPTLVVSAQTSPLTTYRASFEKSAYSTPLFRISGDTKGIDRVPLAVLDAFDGQVFTVGSGAPASGAQGSGGQAVSFTRLPGGTSPSNAHRVTFSIEHDLGIWTPMPAGLASAPAFSGSRASELAAGFYLDRTSGAAIEIAGGATGRGLVAGDGYTVDVPADSNPSLGAPGATSGIDLNDYPQLAAWVKAQKQPRTAAGFATLIGRLRARGYLSHSVDDDAQASSWVGALKKSSSYSFQASYAGHSTARVEALYKQLVDQQRVVGADAAAGALVAGVGDDEQFAAAGALLARAYGYQSRVVVGVRLTSLAGSGVPACRSECTGSDLAAWIQVKAPSASQWTTFDVEPQYRSSPVLVRLGEQYPKYPTAPEQLHAGVAAPPQSQHDGSSSQAAATDRSSQSLAALIAVARVVGEGLALLVLLALPLITLLALKRSRQRRRRFANVPEVALVGAWAEVRDLWADAGIPVTGATRVAQARTVHSAPARSLAELVDAAVFAQHPPTGDDARVAWDLVAEERERVAASQGRWKRFVVALRPRSLVLPIIEMLRDDESRYARGGKSDSGQNRHPEPRRRTTRQENSTV